MAANDAVYADESGEFDDWLEIFNCSDAAINLNGFFLTDDLDQPTKWPFPDTSIAANVSRGELVETMYRGRMQAGKHSLTWEAPAKTWRIFQINMSIFKQKIVYLK